jgi:formate/nitrite transporter FocA (FNT family)
MKVKSIFIGIVSGILVCLALLLTIILAMIRTIISMAHRIR